MSAPLIGGMPHPTEPAQPRFTLPAIRLDRVIVALGLLFLALGVAQPAQAVDSAWFTVGALIGIAPYLAASIAVAAYAKASGADNLIATAFHGQTAPMIVIAALMGALSPFCSCGVIPLIAALLSMGVPLPAVMAFWLASPLMDPSMFILTAGAMGLNFAIAKTAAAISIGMLGGFGVYALEGAGLMSEPLREGVGNGGCGGSKVRNPKPVAWQFWREGERNKAFLTNAGQNTLFLGKWLALAFALESLMIAWIPAETVVSAIGNNGPLTLLAAVALGVPAYLNGYAALPLVAGLTDQGMAPGVGMAFLLAGGVSSIPAAMAVWALARPPVFAAYLGFAFLGAFLAGAAYGLVG